MHQPEYKKVLYEVFDVLEFDEETRVKAVESFKRKLASELLSSMEENLSQEQREWLKANPSASGEEEKVKEIRESLREAYPGDAFEAKSRPIFKKILGEYVDFMSQDLDQQKAGRLKEIVEGF